MCEGFKDNAVYRMVLASSVTNLVCKFCSMQGYYQFGRNTFVGYKSLTAMSGCNVTYNPDSRLYPGCEKFSNGLIH